MAKMSKKHREKISKALMGKNLAENNGNWKGGRIFDSKNERVLVYKPEHPFATKKGYVYEHRLIMEKHIGRYLRKNELVHHKDNDRSNNNIENLEIMSWPQHMRHHITKHVGCKVEGCSNEHRARGYCVYHYNKLLKAGGF